MMGRRFLLLVSGMLAVLLSPAQVKVNAVILSHEETFTMQSASSGVHRVRTTVAVNNEAGLRQAAFSLMTDSFSSLGGFSGEIVNSLGKKTKIRQHDLQSFSLSAGLADDIQLTHYEPSDSYPFTVTYDYSVNYKNGIICFPTFAPLEDERVKLVKASYGLDLPEGTEIVSHASHVEALPVRKEKGRVHYSWTVADFAPLVGEMMMPPTRELVPSVISAPVSFQYGGTKGTQADWKKFGSWLRSLQEGADVLPEELVSRLKEMTADCGTDLEKLKVLYAYLREHTRYVSIQLGIGGLKPIAASSVAKNGFGDCKALSNYLRAMLKAVGVPSYYYVIHTKREDPFADCPTAGQMNHAMLAVPLPQLQDTVFVECTNPRYPLGYRHEDAAGHEILLVGPDGGEKVRIGRYPDSLSRHVQRTEVTLSADGSAGLAMRRELYLDFVEDYLDFRDRKAEDRTRMLISGMACHPEEVRILAVKDNFDAYAASGRAFCPEIDIDYTMRTNLYAKPSGDRLFVPVNPIALTLPFQKGERINDIVTRSGYVLEDRITVRIPEGYSVESLPPDAVLDTDWGRFDSEIQVDGDGIEIRQRLTVKRFRADKSRYAEYRDFARAVNRCYDASLVLKR